MIDLEAILADDRATNALARFARHGSGKQALAGGIALAAQGTRIHAAHLDRSFGDIDFVARSLDVLSATLAGEFICPHVHGQAAPGRTLAQLVHPDDSVRIDIFRAIGRALARADPFHRGPLTIAVLSVEDQAARAASLCMKVARGGCVVAKHVPDFILLRGIAAAERIDAVWQDYRRDFEPLLFAEAVEQIEAALEEHPERLISPTFNRDPNAVCPNCVPWGAFRPAEHARTFQILGYV